jgi:hypothetical protein
MFFVLKSLSWSRTIGLLLWLSMIQSGGECRARGAQSGYSRYSRFCWYSWFSQLFATAVNSAARETRHMFFVLKSLSWSRTIGLLLWLSMIQSRNECRARGAQSGYSRYSRFCWYFWFSQLFATAVNSAARETRHMFFVLKSLSWSRTIGLLLWLSLIQSGDEWRDRGAQSGYSRYSRFFFFFFFYFFLYWVGAIVLEAAIVVC